MTTTLTTMSHRERVLTTLSHREPDRVPRNATLTPYVLEEFGRRTGKTDPAQHWDWDLANVGFRRPDPLPDLKARFGRFFQDCDCEWILAWETNEYPPEWGVATRPAHYYHLAAPLAPMAAFSSVGEIEAYPFPDYLDEWGHDHLEADVRRLQQAGYPVNASIGWIFQTAWTLRTRERLFIDFYDNPEFARTLLRRITDIRKAQAVRFAEAGVDTISINDDIGTQESMIMSPAMWRQWLKPYMAEVIAAIHRVNPEIRFRYHSDGLLTPVIDDLIAIGVASLITVQPESMDVYEIKRRFGERICLEGTFGLQGAFMRGTADEVTGIVQAQCKGLMPGGGWIASPGNGITPDVPWENLVAFFEALDRYGGYG
jgi:uroporphyrinogen decarboxylase